jgi:hypothetical protein
LTASRPALSVRRPAGARRGGQWQPDGAVSDEGTVPAIVSENSAAH